MTIEQICMKCGTSRATLYRRLKAAGIAIESLRERNNGELTPEGITVISGVLDGVRAYHNDTTHARYNKDNQDTQKKHTQDTSEPVYNVSQWAEIVSLRQQLTETQKQLEEARRQIAQLQQEAVERAEKYAQVAEEHSRALLEIAHGTQKLLTDQNERRGLLGWFKRRNNCL